MEICNEEKGGSQLQNRKRRRGSMRKLVRIFNRMTRKGHKDKLESGLDELREKGSGGKGVVEKKEAIRDFPEQHTASSHGDDDDYSRNNKDANHHKGNGNTAEEVTKTTEHTIDNQRMCNNEYNCCDYSGSHQVKDGDTGNDVAIDTTGEQLDTIDKLDGQFSWNNKVKNSCIEEEIIIEDILEQQLDGYAGCDNDDYSWSDQVQEDGDISHRENNNEDFSDSDCSDNDPSDDSEEENSDYDYDNSDNNDDNEKDDESALEELSSSADSRSSCIIRVTLQCWTGYPLGFEIEGGSNTSLKYICIQSLVPNSPAFECGCFQVGDQLVMIGESCLIGVTLKEAKRILKRASTKNVCVVAQRKSPPMEHIPHKHGTPTNKGSSPKQGASTPKPPKKDGGTPLKKDVLFTSTEQDTSQRCPFPPLPAQHRASFRSSSSQFPGMKVEVEMRCGPGEIFGIVIVGGRDNPLKNIHVSRTPKRYRGVLLAVKAFDRVSP